jgi:VanZ family protein
MKLLRRHKFVLILLGIYWPLIFWLTHIPVPQIARQSGMSDKTMHVLAYFALTFLVWFAVSPYHKVRWNRLKVWIVLMAIIGYAAIDECLQGYVGRSMDIRDFISDIFGVVFALGLLSIISFWPALLAASAVFIVIISNFSNLLLLYPEYYLNVVFHFTAYTAFALIWLQYLDRRSRLPSGKFFQFTTPWILPVLLLLIVKITAPLFGRPFNWIDMAISIFGICTAVLASYMIVKFSRRKKQTPF